MIVFFCLSFVLLFVVFIAFSSITIEIDKIEIRSGKELKNILDCLIIKDFSNFFKFIKIRIKVKLNILHIMPIKIIDIDEDNIKKKIIKRSKKKNKKKVQYNYIKKLNLKDKIRIEMIDINISLGLNNAAHTAIISSIIISILTIFISIIINNSFVKKYKNYKKQNYYESKNFKFKITPVFINSYVFSISIKTKISITIIDAIKEIVMYKYCNFVNNTSKLKIAKGEN